LSQRGTSKLVILTGASGSGKTTLAKAVAARYPSVSVLFFDSVGVPSKEEMISRRNSGESWQRATTFEWMKKIASLNEQGSNVIFEGQMRIGFIEEALASTHIRSARIILVDCDDATRTRRLQIERAQADLANPTMTNWARFLRDEAARGGHERLDTSKLDIATCVERICQNIRVR
jgi:dephospho-CoA kinase